MNNRIRKRYRRMCEAKKLQEMSLEELWALFPIQLTAHRDCWAGWYEEEKALLMELLPSGAAVHHIGSTAIRGIWAKPIIDILVEVRGSDFQRAAEQMERGGYLRMSVTESRVSFNKGYTPEGFAERVFHVHLRVQGDNDEICFRNYLNDNPGVAKAYELLKLRLWKEFEHDRDGYTEAKTEFVRSCTASAKGDPDG